MLIESRKIFASVGSRFTMDRLLHDLEFVIQKNSTLHAIAQIGNSKFSSRFFETTQWSDIDEFDQAVSECDVFVSHAGMGNILLAAHHKKPIVIMPRYADLNEHINDHQIGTASALADKPFIEVVNNAQELELAILNALKFVNRDVKQQTSNDQSIKPLVNAIKNFIHND